MAGEDLDLSGYHVAVLGWAGSRERQLRGVVRWYRERGAEVLTARAQIYRAMSKPDGWAIEGRELAPRLDGAERIIVHLFSNAGFWTYAALLEQRPDLPIDAAVIDSAPGFPSRIGARFYARNSSMAVMPIVLRIFRRPPALHHPLLTPPLWLWMRLWYHFSSEQIAFAERSLTVVARNAERPHLVLYSSADELVRPEHVEAFVERLGSAETERFERSEHIRHMVVHRSRYLDRVAGFLASHLPPPADRSAAG